MNYKQLGNSNVQVSSICLGTMTWGQQNSQDEAFAQLNYAIENDINFIDTAELYPVPPQAKTYSKTETIIGNYLKEKGSSLREKLIIASKVSGRSDHLDWIRNGNNCFNEKNIILALEQSLKRLQTDYIDLYQLHWPDRKTNYFGQLGYKVAQDDNSISIEETLNVIKKLLKQGKIRHYGLSNETPWGAMTFLQTAQKLDMPKPVSIQNPYNLLNRTFEVGLAEVSHRENFGLLAYSPLGFGTLTGKYLNNQKPAGARLTLFGKNFPRYLTPIAVEATKKYATLANSFNLSFAQMSLAFVNQQKFITSNIIGATSLVQLKENIDSLNIILEKKVLKEIEKIHLSNPNPAP